ncbi:uncharacterized protein LOC136040678 [Artemia franciscana]|uniref:uncharacterized protein LOC136040678 n=1 Tax=Artemia franciscana TaxID=6661 RepID=UPI0032DA0D69
MTEEPTMATPEEAAQNECIQAELALQKCHIIDCSNKYARSIPLMDETGKEIINTFMGLFKHRKPRKLETDKGEEFVMNNVQLFLRVMTFIWFSSESELKAYIVEQFNGTIKEKLWEYFTHNNTKRWTDALPYSVDNYNNSYHRSIKMKPIEGSKKGNEKAGLH